MSNDDDDAAILSNNNNNNNNNANVDKIDNKTQLLDIERRKNRQLKRSISRMSVAIRKRKKKKLKTVNKSAFKPIATYPSTLPPSAEQHPLSINTNLVCTNNDGDKNKEEPQQEQNQNKINKTNVLSKTFNMLWNTSSVMLFIYHAYTNFQIMLPIINNNAVFDAFNNMGKNLFSLPPINNNNYYQRNLSTEFIYTPFNNNYLRRGTLFNSIDR